MKRLYVDKKYLCVSKSKLSCLSLSLYGLRREHFDILLQAISRNMDIHPKPSIKTSVPMRVLLEIWS